MKSRCGELAPKVSPPSSSPAQRSSPAAVVAAVRSCTGAGIERAGAAEPRRHAEDLLGQLDDPFELAAAAGQHQAAAGERQPVEVHARARQLEYLLDARAG